MSARSNEGIDESLVGSIAFYNASQDDFFLLVGNGPTDVYVKVGKLP